MAVVLPDGQPSPGTESAILPPIGQVFLRSSGGKQLAPAVPMAAPRTLWRISLQDGSTVHCVLWIRKPKTAIVWYRDDEVEGVEEFEDLTEAEKWAAKLRDGGDCYSGLS